ncbi:cobalamin biosynthesis protein [uncultured Jatrophihabitans sp.]|uniref:cobalamin biosynthesis protein n=1 Tax=uncultured Jatrophihabitans sp. TaxID=1610747 RepID=UPI0035CC6A24
MPARLAVPAGLAIGCALDALFGDPSRRHPVALFGRAAGALERRLYADDRRSGAVFAAAAVVPLTAAAFVVDRAATRRPVVRAGLVAAATWAALGGCSLRRAGAAIESRVRAGDLVGARQLIPTLCGRDPQSLDLDGVTRAAVESLAENTSDAVVGPLVWGALAGLPGVVGYRAVNTLDAMVGHRTPRYARFGTASARLDDFANLAPARLTGAITLAAAPAVGGDAAAGWRAWRADAPRHPSPNAGVCEATAAGVLDLQLGGPTVYAGRTELRPVLGSGRRPGVGDIARAARLSRAVQLGALAVCATAAALLPDGAGA